VGKIEVEHLLSEHKAMSSIPSTEGKKKERENLEYVPGSNVLS
jgi:hypothetical protein